MPLIICFIAGPKIIMMMMIWIFGFLAYKLPKLNIPNIFSWFLVCFFLITGVFCMSFFSSLPHQLGTFPLFWASQFLTDYIVGILIGISVWFLPLTVNKNSHNCAFVIKAQKWFRITGDLTFPIYVLHLPLLVLFKSLISPNLDLNSQFTIIFFSTLLICTCLGIYLELKRKWWVDFFDSLFNTFCLDIKNKKNI